MLRRADNKSSNRLSHRKSASSTYAKPVHTDPGIARQHAQAAATYAFARAEERKSVDMGHSTITPAENKIIDHRRSSSKDKILDQETRGVRRRQSVRFIRPNAVRSQQSFEQRSIQDSINEKIHSSSLQPMALKNEIPVPAVYRPPSRSSSRGKVFVDNGISESYMATLAAYDQYYTKEDDVASTPSSYRRIRKSKSTKTLFTPLKASNILFSNGTPSSDYNNRILNKVPWIQNKECQPILKAPKSMSFLRGGSDHMSASMRQNRDIAVQIARDKFLHQIEQQRLREQPSFLFRAKAWREPKPFRQSVRTGSTCSNGMPVGSTIPAAHQKQGSLRVKARKASNSIRRALQNLFRRSGDDQDEATVTTQQAETRKTRSNGQHLEDSNTSRGELSAIPHSESATVSRVGSRIPSLHTVASAQQLRSRTGSVRSLRSEGSSKSRVTSWTSTVENTVNSRHAQAERERQRLSIIQENGTHISSSSFNRLAISNQFSSYPAFHRPRDTIDNVTPVPGPVDSQRIYLALMKRLDENSPKTILNAQNAASVENIEVIKRIPPRSSSVSSHDSSHRSRAPATIRHVRESSRGPKDSEEQYENDLTYPQENDDVFYPKSHSQSNSSVCHHQFHVDAKEDSAVRQNPIYDIYPVVKIKEGEILSPQQIAARNEPLTKPSRARRETRSTFFGQPSFTICRSTSPYRRALAEADYNPGDTAGQASVGQNPNQALHLASKAKSSAPKYNEMGGNLRATETYSESAYSRSTNGRTPPAQSSQSLILHEDDLSHSGETALAIIDRPTYRSAHPNNRGISLESSQEWKGWLSAEVSALEEVGAMETLIKVDYTLPTTPNLLGHVREYAQIREDTQVSQRRLDMAKQPVGVVQQIVPQPPQLKPIVKQKPSTSSIGITIPSPPPPPLPPPPPVPTRSDLRMMQSRVSLRSIDTGNTQGTLSTRSSALKLAPLTTHQLLQPQSSIAISSTNALTKLVKRNRRPSNSSKPSPGMGTAVDKQFGSAISWTSCSGTENRSPQDELYDSDGAGLMGPTGVQQLDAQALGSKRMVDLFLSSRRRRVAGSDEGNAFL